MSRAIIILMLSFTAVFSLEIPTKKVQMKKFSKSIKVNSQIIQLSNAKQSIMSQIDGKIIKYFIKIGQKVKKDQKIATIKSIELSKLFLELSASKKQLRSIEKNYKISKKLYNSGMMSKQEYNIQNIERNRISSKINSIKSNLALLGVKNEKSTSYTLYADSDGVVTDIIKPIGAVVSSGDSLVTVVNKESIFVKSFVPIRYANTLKIGQKASIFHENKHVEIQILQILPELDKQTQQVVILSTLKEKVPNIFINSFVETSLFIGDEKEYISIDKTALSFYKNEWVVFVPHKEDEHEEHNDHQEHSDHEEHDGHEEEEVLYEVKVIKIIKQNKNQVAIEGLKVEDEYVSDKSYYVKSLLLKSSMGGHGH